MKSRKPTPREQRADIGFVGNNGTTEFIQSLFQLWAFDQVDGQRRIAGLLSAKVGYIPMARNVVAQSFLDRDQADWLLFLDNDMILRHDVLHQLMIRADPVERPIVAGFYPTYITDGDLDRMLPTWSVPYENPDGTKGELGQLMTVPEGDLLMEIHGCGMGCTLIHRSVFERLAVVHADDEWKWFSHDLHTFDERNGPKRCGEDVGFCVRARAQGFKIVGATGVRCGHLKTRRVEIDEDIQPPVRFSAR